MPGTDEADCLACSLLDAPPGGRIGETAHWVVEHCVGPLGLGTLIVKPARHVLHVADLTGEEAAELGPLLTATSRRVTRVLEPEQVYVSLWSHAGGVPGHIHFVVQPVTTAMIERHAGAIGPDLQSAMFAADERPAADTIAAVCDRLRAVSPTG